ncbi:MAG: CHAT domain-containing protein [Aureispira sp.]|nr:CHAT domain-containing protein [Aureispira sp.]
MLFRNILLFLLLWSASVSAQSEYSIQLKEALDTLNDRQIRFSDQHINYHLAAIEYASLVYQNEDNWEEANVYSKPALEFMIANYGFESDYYAQALEKIPTVQAQVLDHEYRIEAIKKSRGRQNKKYASEAIQLGAAYVKSEDWKGYPLLLDVYRLLDTLNHPPKGELFRLASEVLDAYVLDLIHGQMNLEKKAKEVPNSLKHSDALANMAHLILTHEDSMALDLPYDSIYIYLKRALVIEDKLGTDQRYNNVFQLFSSDMKDLYPVEQKYKSLLYNSTPPNDELMQVFHEYMGEVDRVIFLTFDVDDVCKEQLKIIKDNYSKENPYYERTKAKCKAWEEDEDEGATLIEIQQDVLLDTFLSKGPESEEFAVELIKLGILEADDLEEEAAIVSFSRAFEVLSELDFWELDESKLLVKKYLLEVPEPWNEIIRNELEIKTFKDVDDRTGNFLAQAYFKAGYTYFETMTLSDKGKEYYNLGMKTLAPQYKYEALPWLEKIFRLDPEWYVSELSHSMVDNLNRHQVETVMRAPLDSIEQKYGKNSSEYAELLEIIAHSYILDTNMDYAVDSSLFLYQKILDIYEELEGQKYSYRSLLIEITDMIQKGEDHWHVDVSSVFFEKLMQMASAQENRNSSYPKFLKKYADWHLENERFIAAEPLYQTYFDYYKDKSKKEKKASAYVEAIFNIARIYRKTSRLQASFSMYSQAMRLSIENKNYLLYIQCIDNLGLLMGSIEMGDQALAKFELALMFISQLDGTKYSRFKTKKAALLYIKILRHIGDVYLNQKDYETAKKHYQKIRDFEATSKFVDFNRDYSLQLNLAKLYDAEGRDKKAEAFYKRAISKLTDKNDLADANLNFAFFYHKMDSLQKAKTLLLKVLAIDSAQVKVNYPNLSEEERLLFLKSIQSRLNTFLAFSVKYTDSILSEKALNAHLMIKGLALENTNNIKSAIVNSDNVALNMLNSELLALRKKLASTTIMSEAELKEEGIDLEGLKKEIKSIEQKLSRESKALRLAFDKQNKQLNYQQLKKMLGPQDVAIDFIALTELDDYDDYVVNYYGIVVMANQKSPVFIKIASEEDLEHVVDAEVAPNTINYITDALESNYLYELILEPLMPYIDTFQTIHLCPTGILSKIAFNTLRTSPYNNERVIDKWSIHNYSSLRDLLRSDHIDPASAPKNITLIGGVKFSLSDPQIVALAEAKNLSEKDKTKLLTDNNNGVSSSGFDRGSRGEDFNYLPGTLSEVENIDALFTQKDWNTTLLTGVNALEDTLTILDAQKPRILHIATHGFFFSGVEEHTGGFFDTKATKNKSVENRIAGNQDPLLRSGLAMTGINVIWKDGKSIQGLDDGILFAKEVAGMNLFDTELAVLSACETGRGDIDNNEGIMGLQRAFKTAGVQKLILSLWKVPDEQTSELMQLFYSNYLENNDAHASMLAAQKTMKTKYPNPYYWAAFILIE